MHSNAYAASVQPVGPDIARVQRNDANDNALVRNDTRARNIDITATPQPTELMPTRVQHDCQHA